MRFWSTWEERGVEGGGGEGKIVCCSTLSDTGGTATQVRVTAGDRRANNHALPIIPNFLSKWFARL